jgi:putative ABC transport system substrate-binding protein
MTTLRSVLAVAALLLGAPAADAQQSPLPVVGFLNAQTPESFARYVEAFREGLAETGYVEGTNVRIEYRWAGGSVGRLPDLAADLVGRNVTVIFTAGGTEAALAAKAATGTIPLVFTAGSDPVALRLVASLNRPGGNATGIANIGSILEGKRLGLLVELYPDLEVVGALVNTASVNSEAQVAKILEAARQYGRRVEILGARDGAEIEQAFARMEGLGVDAVLVAGAAFFNSHRDMIVAAAARAGLPAVYEHRDFTVAGGLISYGQNIADTYREGGIYVGRVLNGENPADMPVTQPLKFDLVVNAATAATLGIDLPPGILLAATEIIQ